MRLDNVPIPSPCRVQLDEMKPRQRGQRYCEHCQEVVHSLSALTEREARAFLRRTADQEVCISYAVDKAGKLLFAAERRGGLVRLPLAIGVAAAVAACSPSQSHSSDGKDVAVQQDVVEIDPATGAPAASVCAADLERERDLKSRLAEARDEATRARVEAELSKLRAKIDAKGRPLVVAGKMARPPSHCKCPPGDPLCACP